MNKKQEQLYNFFLSGKKLEQYNNRLWLNDDVVNTKTFQAVMRKMFPNSWYSEMGNYVIIK